jgi:hypothetical protein
LDVVALPDAVHDRFTHSQVCGQCANTPLSAAIAWTTLQRRLDVGRDTFNCCEIA